MNCKVCGRPLRTDGAGRVFEALEDGICDVGFCFGTVQAWAQNNGLPHPSAGNSTTFSDPRWLVTIDQWLEAGAP